jgi:hypothetical protein
MKPLVTQKIEFGVRLKNDEIVGERQMPGKGGDGGGSGEREIKRARSAFPPSAGICRRSPMDLDTPTLPPFLCDNLPPSYSPYEDKHYSILCLHHWRSLISDTQCASSITIDSTFILKSGVHRRNLCPQGTTLSTL